MTDRSPDAAGREHEDRGGGMRMGRLLGVPVYVTPAWFLVAAMITVFFAPHVTRAVPGIGGLRYAVSASFALLLYLSVLLHELSHTVVALRLGLPVRRVTLHLLGGFSEIDREPETPGREFAVAVAGPLVSLALGALGLALVLVADEGTVFHVLASTVAMSNLLVGIFNLLPGLPLDGGRVLRAGVWKVSGRPYTGTVAAAWVGRVLAGAVLVSPLVLPAVDGQEVDVVSVLWGALVASFIWAGASQALFAARVRERLPGIRARQMTRRAIPVAADVPLAEAIRQASAAGATGLVVVDRDGRPTGVVSQASVTATPEHRRPWVSVSSVSRRLEPGLVLSADLEGEGLLAAMRQTPATEYLVVDGQGDVFGVLASSDVDQAFISV